MNKKTIILIILVIALLVGAGVWMWKNKAQNITEQQKQSEQNQNEPPQEAQIDTSNWQTYRNEEYGFGVKYPKGYLIKKIKGGIYLKHPTYDLAPNYPAEGGAISIALTNTRIEDHIKSIKKTDPPLSRVISQKEYILDGMKGVEIISTFAEGLDYYDIFIKYNNKEYLISYGGTGFDYIKEILSTFKFIK